MMPFEYGGAHAPKADSEDRSRACGNNESQRGAIECEDAQGELGTNPKDEPARSAAQG